MVSVVPPAAGASSYVHVPPNGSFASAMRVTSRAGGCASTTSKVIVPFVPISRHATRPSWSARSTRFTSLRHCGNASTLVIACHTASGGCRRVALRRATCALGSNAPMATIAISTSPSTMSSTSKILIAASLSSARWPPWPAPRAHGCAPPSHHPRHAPAAPARPVRAAARRAPTAPASAQLAPRGNGQEARTRPPARVMRTPTTRRSWRSRERVM